MSSKHLLHYLTLLLAIVQPIILVCLFGEQRSISAYWETDGQPLFIGTNAVVSYFLFNTRHWKVPSLFLLLLTAFSVQLYPIIHNIAAGGFFITSLYPMLRVQSFNGYVTAYLFAGLVSIGHGLYGEVLAIYVICAYHAHILLYLYFIKKRCVK